MKLYVYDHCPYCVRAVMAAGLRGVAAERVVLLNDDEDTPIGLIGAKQVPILQKPDGSHMGESLDIVAFFDAYADGEPLVAEVRDLVRQWLDAVHLLGNRLMMPRAIRLGLPEFATQSAVDYFVAKKERQIGSFAVHLLSTDRYLTQINAALQDVQTLLPAGAAWFNGAQAGMEDVLLFPLLRNLTMVRGIDWPPRLAEYLRHMSAQSGVELYFDRAL